MATDKPKIQGYVDQQTWQAFQRYQLTHRLSQSQALEVLLNKALQLTDDGFTGNTSLDSRLESLEQKQHEDYDKLKNSITGVLNKVECLEIALKAYSQVDAEQIGKILNRLDSNGNPPSNLPSDPLVAAGNLKLHPMRQRDLAKRLGLNGHSAITYHKKKGDLNEWSKQHDPNGIGWRFDDLSVLFYPVADGL